MKKQIGCCGCTTPFFNGGNSRKKSIKKNMPYMKKQKGGSILNFARDYDGNFLNAQDPLNIRNLTNSYKFNNIDVINQPIAHPKYMNPLV
jgi:hypothetical protein